MLSVLIPVFNRDIRASVAALQTLVTGEGIPFEIICLDDGSLEEIVLLNQEIIALEGVFYGCLKENIGRAAIRNLLADVSSFDYLLFLDADFQIPNPSYLKDYLDNRREDCVVVGGSLYPPNPPADTSLLLRWRYGKRREQLPLAKRRRMGWRAFTTHHFLIPRAAFFRVRFDESLRNYGHEDTLFGQELQAAGFTLLHTDNPLMHEELDTAVVFLEKVEQSVCNLYNLYQQGKAIPSTLWRAFTLLNFLHLAHFAGRLFSLLGPMLKRQLLGHNPKLWVLDLYKLLYLCYLKKSGYVVGTGSRR